MSKKNWRQLETTLNNLQLNIDTTLIQRLKEVNQDLWQIEDDIRESGTAIELWQNPLFATTIGLSTKRSSLSNQKKKSTPPMASLCGRIN